MDLDVYSNTVEPRPTYLCIPIDICALCIFYRWGINMEECARDDDRKLAHAEGGYHKVIS